MVAVVAVILNHLTGWPSGGFVGVDVFFVISGYLIVGQLFREYERTGRVSYVGFYARRFRRILPAAWYVLAVVAAASWVLTPGTRLHTTLVDELWAMVFAMNVHLGHVGTDYFAQSLPPSPIEHFWSLSVEEQFYLVAPWFLLATLALGVRVFGWDTNRRRRMAGVVFVIVFASFVYAVALRQSNPTGAYFSAPARAWELGVGALLAVASATPARVGPAGRSLLSWLGLLGILVSCALVPAGTGLPVYWLLLPVLSTALVIFMGSGEAGAPAIWPLTNPVSNYLGDISYSLYLWHFPVFILATAIFVSGTPHFYLLVVPLVLALAVASYHCIELPVRRGHWPARGTPFSARPALRGLGPAAAFTAVLLMGLTVVGVGLRPPTLVFNARSTAARCLGAARLAVPSCRTAPLAQGVTPSPRSFSADGGLYGCFTEPTQTTPQTCSYGSSDPNAPRIALVGDSHAEALLPALLASQWSRRWHIDVFTGNDCEWRVPTFCPAMPIIQARLLAGKYDVVVTSADRTFSHQYTVNDFTSYWRPVQAKGTRIVVVGDAPSVDPKAIECVGTLTFRATSGCATSRRVAFTYPDVLLAAAASLPSVRVVDLSRLYCTTAGCPVVIGNAIVYRDTSPHVTATYMQTLAPYLDPEILSAARQS